MSEGEDDVPEVQQQEAPKPRRQPKAKKPKTGHQTRLTQYEVMERRKQVENLRLRGISIAAIAKLLSISPSQVSKDLKVVQRENILAVEQFDKAELLAEVRSRWSEVEERAWAAYHRSGEVGDQLKALNLVRVTQSDKIKAHIDVGLISKESIAVSVHHTHQLDWSDDMKHKVARALLESSLTPQLAEAIPEDVIDVTPTEAEPAESETSPYEPLDDDDLVP